MRNGGIANFFSGSFTGAGAIVTLTPGFVPGYVVVFNETDALKWEKLYDQVAANSIKTVTAGTQTTDTTSAIVINSDGTVTLSAALAANAKAIKYAMWA